MRTHAAVVLACVLLTSSSVIAQPLVQRGPKLVGAGAVGAAGQGSAVAISADGSTAIVGGQMDDGRAGAAWVYIRSNGKWTQQGPKLVGTGAVPCCLGKGNQGSAVAISADGNTALVGGWSDNNAAGAAWVFVRSGGVWTQQGSKLVGTGASGTLSSQGSSVALSADGNTALVGGPTDGFGVSGSVGATWVFTRTGSTWTQQGSKLVGTGATEAAGQGTSVALSADGNTAAIGGPADDSSVGAGWVFVRSGATWTQQQRVTPADAARFPHFGSAVTLSADGNTAAFGGPLENTGPFGAVWVFARSASTWTQQGAKLVGSGAVAAPSLAYQGTSVSLSGDGNVLIEGAPRDGTKGAAWVFVRSGTTWTQAGNKLVGTGGVENGGDGVSQGTSVALSSDGLTAIVGGWNDNAQAGAAWMFTRADDLLRASDHDDDALSDITVYHAASGMWSSLTSASGFSTSVNRGWGGPAYTAVPGDYDGDGKTDLGVYDSSTADWYVLLSSTNFTSVLWKNAGGPGWQAVPRDYDGDGKTDFVVYNVTTGQWWGLTSSTGYAPGINVNWGGSGYLPVAADYDGDLETDLGVYNTTTGVWSVLLSSTNYTTSLGQSCGGAGWAPVPADYDGDGKADFVVYDSNTGHWFGLLSSGSYATTLNMMWGGSTYQPVKGDFDGDGRADLATYVNGTGMWYILLSGANYTTAMTRAFGGPGYAAVPQYP